MAVQVRIIRAGGPSTTVYLGLNGRTVEIPVGVTVTISDAEFEILKNSGLSYVTGPEIAYIDIQPGGGGSPFNAVLQAGGDPTGEQDSTLAFQRVAASLPDGGKLHIPPGTFAVSGNVDLGVKGVTVEGSGLGSTFIKVTHPTNTIFTARSAYGSTFRGFTMFHGVQRTGGAYIDFDPGAGAISYAPLVDHVQMSGYFIGIDHKRSSGFIQRDCYQIGSAWSVAGTRIDNRTNGDAGDSKIAGGWYNGGGGIGVQQIASGGLSLIGSKFNGGTKGYSLELNTEASGTSILLTTACSFENQTVAGMVFRRTGGSSIFTYATIIGNEFAYAPIGIDMEDNGAVFYDFKVSNNVFGVPSNGRGIRWRGSAYGDLADNTFDSVAGPSIGIDVGGAAQSTQIGINRYRNIDTPIVNTSASASILQKTVKALGSVAATVDNGDGLYAGIAMVSFPAGSFALLPTVQVSPNSPGLFGVVDPASITLLGCTVQVYSRVPNATVTFTVLASGI